MSKRIDDIARAIIENGHPYARGWYDDGTVETGPSGGVIFGYRWGSVSVELDRYGHTAWVWSRKCGDAPWGVGQGMPLILASTSAPDVIRALNVVADDDAARERGRRQIVFAPELL